LGEFLSVRPGRFVDWMQLQLQMIVRDEILPICNAAAGK
jgi:hypothetical protein